MITNNRHRRLAGLPPDWAIVLGLVLVHVSLALFYRLGLGVDITANPGGRAWDWWWQLLPVELLRTDLWRSLWYMHSQPPLYNLYGALFFRLAPGDPMAAMQYANIGLGALIAAAGYVLLKLTTGRRLLAAALGLGLALDPALFLFEAYLLYDLLTTFWLVAGAALLAIYAHTRRFRYAALFFLTITLLVLTRSVYHVLVLPIGIGLVAVVERRRLAVTLAAGALIGAAAIGLYAKNYALYGFFGGSSWQGFGLWKVAAEGYSPEELAGLAQAGVIDPMVAEVEIHRLPSVYAAYGYTATSPIPVLNRDDRHNLNMVAVARAYQQSALRLIARDPLRYARSAFSAYLIFSIPSAQFKHHSLNAALIAPHVRLVADGLQGHWLEPYARFPFGSAFFFLVPLSVLAYLATQLDAIGRRKSGLRSALRDNLALTWIAFLVVYTTLVSIAFEIGENNREKFYIEQLVVILGVALAARWVAAWRRATAGDSGAVVWRRIAAYRPSSAAVRWVVFALGLAGAGLILVSARWGVGTSPDSVAYLGAASNLLAGRGLTMPFGAAVDGPLTQFPPLYPLSLAALAGLARADVAATARVLAAVLFAANIMLVARLLAQARDGAWLPALGAGLMLVSPAMFALHTMAWSEPLFLLLGFGGLLALAGYLEHGRWPALLAAGGLIGLACLVRYAGLAFLGAALVALLPRPARLRVPALRPGLALGVLGGIPLVAWSGRNALVAGSATTRTLAWHPLQLAQVRQALDTLAGWLLVPLQAGGIIKLGALLAVVGGLAGLAALRRRAGQAAWPPIVRLLALFVAVYALFLLVSISLLDANTPLDDRILAPVYVATLCLGVYLLAGAWQLARRGRGLRVLAAAVVIGFAALSLLQTTRTALAGYRQGIGFHSRAWQQSEVLSVVRGLPGGVVIYSNAPEAVWLHTGRSALRIPRQFNASQQAANPEYAAELARMAADLEASGLVVYFGAVGSRSAPSQAEVVSALGLEVLARAADGTLYGLRSGWAARQQP